MKAGYWVFLGVMGSALTLVLLVPPLERVSLNKAPATTLSKRQFMKPEVVVRPHPACGFHADGSHKPGVLYCMDIMTFLGVLHQCSFVRCSNPTPLTQRQDGG